MKESTPAQGEKSLSARTNYEFDSPEDVRVYSQSQRPPTTSSFMIYRPSAVRQNPTRLLPLSAFHPSVRRRLLTYSAMTAASPYYPHTTSVAPRILKLHHSACPFHRHFTSHMWAFVDACSATEEANTLRNCKSEPSHCTSRASFGDSACATSASAPSSLETASVAPPAGCLFWSHPSLRLSRTPNLKRPVAPLKEASLSLYGLTT